MFTCTRCHKKRHNSEGQADEHFNWCDECWGRAHRKLRLSAYCKHMGCESIHPLARPTTTTETLVKP